MQRRRTFLKHSSLLIAGSAFPNIWTPPTKDKVGVALVGLGYYSTDLLAPALKLTKYCELKGIVTGTPSKIPVWQRQYGISDRNVYNYGNMHRIADNDEIDVIYIVLPNSMHSEYAVIAAGTGKHVWCEKPMAVTEEECQAIIDACNKNNVKLTIGYRMQHEPNTQTLMGFAKSKPYGDIRTFSAKAGYRNSGREHWKLRRAMGGGAMYDMGVYPLNAARYCTQEEPIAVTARHETTRPDIFTEVDETTFFTLEFESGIVADCMTTFGQSINELHVECTDGWYGLKPFSTYSGIRGETSSGRVLNTYIPNEQAKQMDDDALAILHDTDVIVPGEDGQKDVRIVEAIYQSAREGRRVEL